MKPAGKPIQKYENRPPLCKTLEIINVVRGAKLRGQKRNTVETGNNIV